MVEQNTVFIGKKEPMAYVLAVVTVFSSGSSEVTIKARGRAISKAVDVAEITKNKFIPGLEVKDIQISTEELPREDGTKMNVSSIEIFMKK